MSARTRILVGLFATLDVTACGSDEPSVVSSGSSSTAPDSDATGTTGTSTGTSDDPSGMTTPLGDGHGCCEPHDPIGCDEFAVQTCVCDDNPVCCAFRWDEACVQLALACDATCMPDPEPTATAEVTGATDPSAGDSSGDVPPGDGACCEVQSGTGCDDAGVTACTCDLDPYCCNTQWDEYCVAIASQSCAIDCANDCCTPHDAIACNDADVFGCVVEQLESCFGTWDAACVAQATGSCGLDCG